MFFLKLQKMTQTRDWIPLLKSFSLICLWVISIKASEMEISELMKTESSRTTESPLEMNWQSLNLILPIQEMTHP